MNEITMQNYETKCLFDILNSVANKREAPILMANPRWAMMVNVAEFHNIPNLMYYGTLGIDRKNNTSWKERIEKQYHAAVHGEQWYSAAINDIIKYFEHGKIHFMLLKDFLIREYYPQNDMRQLKNVRILVDKGSEEKIENILKQLDYTFQEDLTPDEKLYVKVPGVSLIIQTGILFQNKRLRKFFSTTVKDSQKKAGYDYYHEFSKENFYTYLIVNAADCFAKGTVDIREMLDIWRYYSTVYSLLDFSVITPNIELMDLEKFHNILMKMLGEWFGGIDCGTKSEAYYGCEKFVLSKGGEGREACAKILPPLKDVTEIYEKDLKRQRRKESRHWAFPPLSYMVGMFPTLEKAPFLLPFFWLVRLFRVWTTSISRKFKKATLPARSKTKRNFRIMKADVSGFFTKIRKNFASGITKIKLKLKNINKK